MCMNAITVPISREDKKEKCKLLLLNNGETTYRFNVNKTIVSYLKKVIKHIDLMP